MEFVDVHAHLTDEKFYDLFGVVDRARENSVNFIVTSAYDISSSKKSIEIAGQFENVYATVGIHPENVQGITEDDMGQIKLLANEKKVVAVGEIGLDYYWVDDNKELQKEIFVKQIELANELNLPIVVHSRDAMGDTIEILKKNPPKRNSLLHCYSGSVESAKLLIELGFSFSFGGVSTFKNAKNVVEVIKFLPIERILLETDCPYLTPEPFRGKRNEPKNIVYIADAIAKIKGLSLEDVAEITTKNAKGLFSI